MKSRLRIIKTINYLSKNILPLIFWLSLIMGFDELSISVLTIICAVIHETGHIVAIISMNVEFKLRAHVTGFRISEHSLSYRDDILILLCGPLANFLVWFLSLLLQNACDGYFATFGTLNLITAISNLLPIEGYDGYGILANLLDLHEMKKCRIALGIISFAMSLAFALLSLYLLSRYNVGYWIFGLFFAIILLKIKENLSRT